MKNKPGKGTGARTARGEQVNHSAAKPASKAENQRSPLSKDEQAWLKDSEEVIGSGLASFFKVGAALRRIRDARLYRVRFETFQNYCSANWGISRQYAYRLVDAAVCYEALKAAQPRGGVLPLNEAQLRPLVKYLKPQHWAAAWKSAVSKSRGDKPTAEVVEKVARGLAGQSNRPKPKVQQLTRESMPKRDVAKLVKTAEVVLRKQHPTLVELKAVLATIRDSLSRYK